ncbi:hypothetical protein ACE3MZ_00995 [Paenibacillus sp. WLX1005]|uniref:hypothetical protein n=1 Tax=Paenibacillus sp. WLX1005 TaxID=3243766 RepID=UPI0039841636
MKSMRLGLSNFFESTVHVFKDKPYKSFFDVVFLSAFLFLFPYDTLKLEGAFSFPLMLIGLFLFANLLILLLSKKLGDLLKLFCEKTNIKIGYIYLFYAIIFVSILVFR